MQNGASVHLLTGANAERCQCSLVDMFGTSHYFGKWCRCSFIHLSYGTETSE